MGAKTALVVDGDSCAIKRMFRSALRGKPDEVSCVLETIVRS